jgi:hypothetical protein
MLWLKSRCLSSLVPTGLIRAPVAGDVLLTFTD